MDRSTAFEMAAIAATVLATVGALPQLRRVVRTGDVAGMSLSFATLGVASEMAWVGYAIHGRLWSAVPEGVIMTTTNAYLARMLVRAGMPVRRAVIAGVAWGAVLALSAAFGGETALAALLPVAYAVQVAPLIWRAYRTFSPSGVAAVTWGLVGIEALLWGMYGLHHQDGATTLFGIVGSVAAAAILIRKLTTRHRDSDSRPAPARSLRRAHGFYWLRSVFTMSRTSWFVAASMAPSRSTRRWRLIERSSSLWT